MANATSYDYKSKLAKKEPPSATLIAQQCQDVIRTIISTEKFGSLSNMLNCGLAPGYLGGTSQFKNPTPITGSLDLQLISVRLSTGAYGQTPEMFSADMKEVLLGCIRHLDATRT